MSRSENKDFEGCGKLALLIGTFIVAGTLAIVFNKPKNLEGKIVEIRAESGDNLTGRPKNYKALWESPLFGKRWYNLDVTKNYKKGDLLTVPEDMHYEPFRVQNTDKK